MITFTTAQDTFDAPTAEQIANLMVGSSVKVCINNEERVWTKITEIDGDEITATVDNEPYLVDLDYGDTINFKTHHIYDVFDIEERIDPRFGFSLQYPMCTSWASLIDPMIAHLRNAIPGSKTWINIREELMRLAQCADEVNANRDARIAEYEQQINDFVPLLDKEPES